MAECGWRSPAGLLQEVGLAGRVVVVMVLTEGQENGGGRGGGGEKLQCGAAGSHSRRQLP